MKMIGNTLLRKIELSNTFLRRMLCARKLVLEAGLNKLGMTVIILALKSCAGHARANSRLASISEIGKKNASFQNGCNKHVLKASPREAKEIST